MQKQQCSICGRIYPPDSPCPTCEPTAYYDHVEKNVSPVEAKNFVFRRFATDKERDAYLEASKHNVIEANKIYDEIVAFGMKTIKPSK